MKKYFCYKTSEEISLNIISSDSCIILYKKLKPYKNNANNFIIKFFEFSKNKEIEHLLCIENLMMNNIFLETLKKIDQNILIEVMNKKILEKQNYNSIINYFHYLFLKSKIILNKKKWNIFKIKKLLTKKENSEKLIKILTKKINLLSQLNLYIKNDIIINKTLESISKKKRKNLFLDFSYDIFKQIILFTIQIKNFKEQKIKSINELLITLNNIIENFSHITRPQKKNKKYILKKIDKINNHYIIGLIQNIRYFLLDNDLNEFFLSLSFILKNLLKEFPEETELIFGEISKLVYKKNDLSTIYEESCGDESMSFFRDSLEGMGGKERKDRKERRFSCELRIGSVSRFKE